MQLASLSLHDTMAEVIIDNSNNASSYGGHATQLKVQSPSTSPTRCPSRSGPSTPESDQLRLHVTATASVVVPPVPVSVPASNDNDIKRHYNNNNNDERSPPRAPEIDADTQAEAAEPEPKQMMAEDHEQQQEQERMVDDDDNCNDEDETASSCGSELDSGDGRLQIVLNNNNNNNTISGSGKLVTDNERPEYENSNPGTRQEHDVADREQHVEDNVNMEHDGGGIGGEDEEDFYEQYRQQQQQLYQQLTQQQQKQLFLQQYKQYGGHSLLQESNPASGGLTVTKFPINGHARGNSGSSGSSNGKHATAANNLNARISSSPESEPGVHGLGVGVAVDQLPFHASNGRAMAHSASSPSPGPSPTSSSGPGSGRSVADLMMNGYAQQSQHYNKYSQMLLQQDLDLRQQQSHSLHASRRSRGHGHGHGLGLGLEPYNVVKSEKRSSGRSQSNSPPQTQFLTEVKPENLATGSQAQQLQSLPLPLLTSSSSPSPANTSTAALSQSLSNALLNLASLGNLAALQQQAQAMQNNNSSNNGLGLNSANASVTPLNLTSTNGNLSGASASMRQHHLRASPPPASSSYLAQLIGQHQLNFQQQASMNTNMNMNPTVAQNLLNAGNPASSSSPGMPQLILASGNIVQGIQGAQLLIPSPQGLMTQTILTIPISSPGSPPSATATNLPSPPIRGSHPSSSSLGSSSRRNNGHHGSSSAGAKLHPHAHAPARSPSPTQLPRPPSSSRGSASASPNDLPLLNLATPSSSSAHSQHLVNRHHARACGPEQGGAGSSSQSRASPISGTNSQLNSAVNFANDRQGDRHGHGQLSQQQSSAISCVVNGPNVKREHSSTAVPANQLISSLIPVNSPGSRSSAYGASKLSPHSLAMLMEQDEEDERLDEEGRDSDYDKCSFNDDDDDDGEMIEGINLDEIKEFAKAFKLRRLSLGLTQTQVGQALSVTEGPSYSQSAICSALAWQLAQSQSQSQQLQAGRNRSGNPQSSVMFEKLDITPKSAQKIKPVLERWMKEAEDRYRNGNQNLNDFVGMEPSKKRKRRTSFTPQALEILNVHFERNTHPSGAEITTLAHQLGYEREVIRIWFCNKRQALKNTVRMMSKSGSPM